MLIAVRMPWTPGLVDCHLAFVVLICILFANYNDWQHLGHATPSVQNETRATQEQTTLNVSFETQLGTLRESFHNKGPTSLSSSGDWVLPCAEPSETDDDILNFSTQAREELIAWNQRINQVAMDFDTHITDGIQLPYDKTMDDGTVFKAHPDGKRYFIAPDGARVTFSHDNSSIALDVSGNVVRISSTGTISQLRADSTHIELSTGGDRMSMARADGTEFEVDFRDSNEPPTVVTPNYKHARWFLGDVAPYKVAGDGRSVTCIALCKPPGTSTNETKPQSEAQRAETPESSPAPHTAKSAELSPRMVVEGGSANSLADTSESRSAATATSEPIAQSVTSKNDGYCGAWLSDGEKCFLYDRRSLNVSSVVPVCWTTDVAPPAPFTRWGAVATTSLNGENVQANDEPVAMDADAVVALAKQHHTSAGRAWALWTVDVVVCAVITATTSGLFMCFFAVIACHKGTRYPHTGTKW